MKALKIQEIICMDKNRKFALIKSHTQEELIEAIAELEELQNRSCENCKHCDAVYENIIHCQYFEELLPKEIGKCDIYTKKG